VLPLSPSLSPPRFAALAGGKPVLELEGAFVLPLSPPLSPPRALRAQGGSLSWS